MEAGVAANSCQIPQKLLDDLCA